MARIVDDLRLLADAGGGEFLQPELIDLTVLRDDLLAKAQVLGERRWLAEGEPSGSLFADRHQLTEAVMKLADNAVRHTATGAVIAIGAAATAQEVRLWVRDTGPGVAPTDQARIFDRFRRGSGAYRAYRGSACRSCGSSPTPTVAGSPWTAHRATGRRSASCCRWSRTRGPHGRLIRPSLRSARPTRVPSSFADPAHRRRHPVPRGSASDRVGPRRSPTSAPAAGSGRRACRAAWGAVG